jgi:hypothetical protein
MSVRTKSRVFSQSRRWALTFLGFLMAATLVSSISICIDTQSLPVWNEMTDVGPTAMEAHGPGIETYLDAIASIDSVTAAARVRLARAYLRMDQNDVYQGSPDDPIDPMFLLTGKAYSFNEDFPTIFPDEFAIVDGRYPQNSSEIAIPYSDATYWSIPLGRMMNYTHTLNGVKHTVFVVGFFQETADNAVGYYSQRAIAIVTEDVLNPEENEARIFVDVDRHLITPNDGRASLQRLKTVKRAIQQLNPDYSPESPYSLFLVDSKLIEGVESYINWLDSARQSTLMDSQIEVIMIGLLTVMATSFNVRARKEHDVMIQTRGGSRRRILLSAMSELIVISLIAFLAAVILGANLSDLGNTTSAMTNPIISADTLGLMIALAFFMPMVGYGLRFSEEKDVQEEVGRLGRLSQRFKRVRWDLAVVIGCILFASIVGALDSALITGTPLGLLLVILPYAIFIGIASLFFKSYASIARGLSRVVSPLIGRTSAEIGARAVPSNARTSILFILVFSLILVGSISSSIERTTLPATAEAQMHYAIGGDLILQLNPNAESLWNQFAGEVSDREGIESASLVSTGLLSLAEGSTGQERFVAVIPNEFGAIGYSHTGIVLNRSSIGQLLEELAAKPDGAIITTDIASEYELIVGDTLRIFSIGSLSQSFEFRILGIRDLLPVPQIVESASSTMVLGVGNVWLSREYLNNQTSLRQVSNNYLCAKAISGVNATSIAQDIIEANSSILYQERWTSIDYEMERYLSQNAFIIHQSIDNLTAILYPLILAAAYIITLAQNRSHDSRRRGILRTLGMKPLAEVKLGLTELLSFFVLSGFMLLIFGSVFIHMSLEASQIQYSIWTIEFPVERILVISSVQVLSICATMLLPLTLLAIVSSWQMRIKNLSSALSADWTVDNSGGSL